MKEEFALIYSTVPDEKTGKKIIKHLLEKNLVACGNLFSEGTSFFHWEGKIQTAKESVVILKTSAKLYKQIEMEVKKLHPYDCPCILSLPVKEGYKSFLDWIDKNCSN